ncbi:cyclic nucleotide-binding domain-containing protein [Leptothoe spongobia]|uniref:Cyclic nucleotide-binding domain-containing protein n=1 Tax=Leptothoe spongobia TAU-MAC 1115 TaxID=1967444 RepID=A0A947DHX9_9CYAN|nr:cyclic nucleotide-binding domain-containing protein [Leptothoe spongobia]MBT9316679.1 cyclic nucleotide-binding domain-containing protein [Leptothoe spongobia TAU-MAC 1115]
MVENSTDIAQIPERVAWLKATTCLHVLTEEVLVAIATHLHTITLQANRRLILEDTQPDTLYILKTGQLERYRTRRTSMAQTVDLQPGAVLHLQEILLDQPTDYTVITLEDCELWQLSADRLKQIAYEYPSLSQEISELLAEEVEQLSAQLLYEQERQQELRPYLVPKVSRGVVGASRYAQRLRQDVREAASVIPNDQGQRDPVLIFGEPGLEKDNLAALIHFGSASKKEPMIKVNCETLRAVDLFGRGDSRPGLLDWLGKGTLLLNNIQDLNSELRPAILRLIKTGQYQPSPQPGNAPAAVKNSSAWIMMISEKSLAPFANLARQKIKVPPLRVRKGDIEAQINYYIQLDCVKRGLRKPTLTPEALRRLQSYDFPRNLRELDSLVQRAIQQAAGAPRLNEEVFWSASEHEDRFRWNLLNTYPKFRQFLRSPWWPDRINFGFTSWFYILVVALLFLGPQTRDANVALNFFWAWWWPLILLSFPFVGRLWCAVCPFMIYGEITQKLSLWLWPRQLGAWPRQWAERWGGWILYGGFAAILIWEELWDLENTAYLSAWLLLIITAGAMICSALFERRFWCRYLCPIGGMNGLFAKLSMTELRGQRGICSASCSTYQCYKGGPEKGEGQETGGCPVYSHPAQLVDNRNCVLCMTCLKACPHRSVEFNLRPPGIELWTTHTPVGHEVALMLLLWGAVFVHRLPEVADWLGVSEMIVGFGGHAIATTILLFFPLPLAWIAHKLTQLIQPRLKARPFIQVAYGWLPIVLLSSLAHYLTLGLTEAGRIVPVSLASFGLASTGPVIVAHPAIIAFLQGICLIFGAFLSVLLTQRIARHPGLKVLPLHGLTIGMTAVLYRLIV